ncbi:MAG TPA: autorepressor SdpR family transcription factor [Thermoanaerobaculia bacterium]|nr:autorepressor SdpR family transcription factor [Thermoanaerobaculia bacterium]
MRSQHVFKALADPTRRDILRMLRKRALTAGEIGEAFPMTKGSLSHHFNILKEADLVRCERNGQFQLYSLNTTVVEDVMSLLAEVLGERGRKKK